MSRKLIVLTILLSIIAAVLVETFWGNFIAARLSTIPVLQRWHLISPQAPIVITHREEVRVSDSTDAVEAFNKVKSRLSSVVSISGSQVTTTGAALNLTSDGYFLTALAAFGGKPAVGQTIALNNGQTGLIEKAYPDSVTNLVIVKTSLSDVPIVTFAQSASLLPGEKALFAHSSMMNFSGHFQQSYVISEQRDSANRFFFSDRPTRNFGVQQVGALTPGEAVVNLSGEVTGIWDGASLVSSDVISAAFNNFFNHDLKFIRSSWGFSYRMIDSAESALLNLPVGAVVDASSNQPAVLPNSPASVAGLQAGDVITAINEQSLENGVTLEEVLERINPGQTTVLAIVRNRNRTTLSITPSEVK